MPGLDEFNKKMEALKLLLVNYDRAIDYIKKWGDNDIILFDLIISTDAKIREELK